MKHQALHLRSSVMRVARFTCSFGIAVLLADAAVAAGETCRPLVPPGPKPAQYAVATTLRIETSTDIIKPLLAIKRAMSCEQALALAIQDIAQEFPDYRYWPSSTIVVEIAQPANQNCDRKKQGWIDVGVPPFREAKDGLALGQDIDTEEFPAEAARVPTLGACSIQQGKNL